MSVNVLKKPWRVVNRSRWKNKEASMPVLESRSCLHAVKHVVRTSRSHGKHIVILGDSLTVGAVMSRWRASTDARELLRVSRGIAAHLLATNITLHYRWIPSEWNPADGPSRSLFAASRLKPLQFKDRDVGPRVAPIRNLGLDMASEARSDDDPAYIVGGPTPQFSRNAGRPSHNQATLHQRTSDPKRGHWSGTGSDSNRFEAKAGSDHSTSDPKRGHWSGTGSYSNRLEVKASSDHASGDCEPLAPPKKLTAASKAKMDRARKRSLESEVITGMGVLRSAAVKRARQGYIKAYNDFLDWLRANKLHASNAAMVDEAMCERMDELYLEGAGSIGTANILKASVLFFNAFLRSVPRPLPGVTQALKGWRNLSPTMSRLPYPKEVIDAFAMALMHAGLFDAALAALVIFEMYLRPGEIDLIRESQLVPPVPNSRNHRWYAIVLNPGEAGVTSKTLEFDNALSFDLVRHQHLARALDAMLKQRLSKRAGRRKSKELPLFKTKSKELTRLLLQFHRGAKLSALGPPHLYRFRHSAASHDFGIQARSLEEVRRRGRWRAWSSVRRYEKGARRTELMHLLSPDWLKYALNASRALDNVVAGQRSPLQPPSTIRFSSP